MADTENIRKLRYEAELNPLWDYIEANYSESSLCVFRSTISSPPTEKDSTPQSKRDEAGKVQELDMTLTQEEVVLMTDKEKKEYVGNLAISVFSSREKAEKSTIDFVRHVAKFSYEEAEVYLNERRGAFIVKMQLSPDVGLLENRFNKKGHANLLLYEGVDINDWIVETFLPLKIEDIIQNANKAEINDGNTE